MKGTICGAVRPVVAEPGVPGTSNVTAGGGDAEGADRMDERMLGLLAQVDRGDAKLARLDQRAVREDALTSREVALLIAAGVGAAARVVSNVDEIRSSLADLALAWRNVVVSAPPMPPPMMVVAGFVQGLALMAPRDAIAGALRCLVENEPFWRVAEARRGR